MKTAFTPRKIWLPAVLLMILVILQPCVYGEIQLKEQKRFEGSEKVISKSEVMSTAREPLNIQNRVKLTSSFMTEPKTVNQENPPLQGSFERGTAGAAVNGFSPDTGGRNESGTPSLRQNPLRSRYRVRTAR